MPPDLADELFRLADDAASMRDAINQADLQQPLSAIHDACEQVKRSWSGSNIGYHATVYYGNLDPVPPNVEFSTEWGLMDRWPTHRPDPGWRRMEFDVVEDAIYGRAGDPNVDAITEKLETIRERFLSAQDAARSVMTAVLAKQKDGFLEAKFKQIDSLVAPNARQIEGTLTPGRVWSRDSLAMGKGIVIAPHQKVVALSLSATTLKNGIETFERTVREVASHLRRTTSRKERAQSIGTNVFIGHGRSPIWRELSDFVEKRLGLPVDEFNSVPVAGIATTARLKELLDAAAFAFLIMTAEDEQRDGKVRARENVVHEAGLFQGRLGFERAIILIEDDCEEFSNIHGLGQIRFPKGNISAKFEDIRAVLEREGLIEPLK